MTPKSQAKIKPSFPQYPFLTIFNPKKVRTNIWFWVLITFMRLYSNVYNYAIYTLNYYEDKYFISLFAHFKHTVKIYDKCTYTLIFIKKIK